jgi:urease alpha subunit
MSPISNISPVKFAFAVAVILGAMAAGLAVRGAASVDVPLGAMDDYGIRHAVVAESRLTLNDDFGTRNQAPASELTLNDDFGTRNQAAKQELTTADDFGTRHGTQSTELGPNDDYATRQSR